MFFFPNKQGHSFQFQKKSKKDLSLLPVSLHQLKCFQIFIFPFKKCAWSFQNIWLLLWMEGEISEARKKPFVNVFIEVWRTLSTYILLRNSKYLSHTYESFQTWSIKLCSVFKTQLALDSSRLVQFWYCKTCSLSNIC